MSAFGQPDDYSQMLRRIFWCTLIVAILCNVLLTIASPEIKEFMDFLNIEIKVGPVTGLKALYVLIPLILAAIARGIYLHDKISDVLSVRHIFDTRHILYLLADGVGIQLTEDMRQRIRNTRVAAMRTVFYPYASFTDAPIDKQLIRSALDRWGWFWVAVESSFFLIVTIVFLAVIQKWYYLLGCVGALTLLFLFLVYQWSACRRSAKAEVDAIVADAQRRSIICSYFKGL